MVTRAGKDLLRNTIRTVGHHNKILEEQEMWRQWELERGLTMMVSDDVIRARNNYTKKENKSQSSSSRSNIHRHILTEENQHLKKRKSHNLSRTCKHKQPKNHWMRKLMEWEERNPNRWGHSGYKELYPEEFRSPNSSPPPASSSSSSSSSSSTSSSQSSYTKDKKSKHSKRKSHEKSEDHRRRKKSKHGTLSGRSKYIASKS